VAAALLDQFGMRIGFVGCGGLPGSRAWNHGRTALTAALLDAPTADAAWSLAKAQATFARHYPDKVRASVFTQACKYLEAGDRRADALLFLLREGDAADLRERMAKQGDDGAQEKGLRRRAAVPCAGLGAIPPVVYRFGWNWRRVVYTVPAMTSPRRREPPNPSLEQFLTLFINMATPWFAADRSARLVGTGGSVLSIGFHCAESGGPLKKFAAQLLNLVVKRSPRSKIGQAAKSKIRSAGLE